MKSVPFIFAVIAALDLASCQTEWKIAVSNGTPYVIEVSSGEGTSLIPAGAKKLVPGPRASDDLKGLLQVASGQCQRFYDVRADGQMNDNKWGKRRMEYVFATDAKLQPVLAGANALAPVATYCRGKPPSA